MATNENQILPIEAARKLAELGDVEGAVEAYEVALTAQELRPMDRMEAACAVLQYGGDYKRAYDAFVELCGVKEVHEGALDILTQAFYVPNVTPQKNQYKKNCKLLKKYPYLFRKDFPAFEDLPVKFYPYDDNGVLPYYVKKECFGEYINFCEPIVRHYFFRDLSKPVLAEDIFSQYELEYLRDNVRRSDWVGYENHIYLHYSDWGEFCSYLQCLDMKPLLEDEKFVILIGEEKSLYPIDFKERFGIDYSRYPVKPIGIREINKIIWHTQLHAHNGGDFFNEILHEHPNIFAGDSIFFDNIISISETLLKTTQKIVDSKGAASWGEKATARFGSEMLSELERMENRTLKDAFVAINLADTSFAKHLSHSERIVPAVFFQPHFGNPEFQWEVHESGALALRSSAYNELIESGFLNDFKYIKTFTPLRRPTTSHGATMRFMSLPQVQAMSIDKNGKQEPVFTTDDLVNRITNRSFMYAESDRIFADSRLVRFEDAKLNPKATFTALAEFLDVPYAESMTYCSGISGRDPGNIGFNTTAVYRTYDEYCDKNERIIIEYALRDVYQAYGYDYEHYDGQPMTQETLEDLVENAACGLEWVRKGWWDMRGLISKQTELEGEKLDAFIEMMSADAVKRAKERRHLTLRVLNYNLPFCNEKGERLRLMKMLEPVPELMEQPRYH